MLTKDFRSIVLNENHLIDVRAPIEYAKGAFPNSINLPIMNDEERHQVGIKYKEEGNEVATALGHQLVGGPIKEERIAAWQAFMKDHPDALLYCFRGGARSRISQEWLEEAGTPITRLEGGYKAFRNYLLEILNGSTLKATPITLGGHTGSGKTILIKKLQNAVDLEGIAHHRGSSFGRHIDPQPSQIDFENTLAYRLIQHEAAGYHHLILEDESRNVGKCFINQDLMNYFRSGHMVLVQTTIEERVVNTLEEYVTLSQKAHVDRFGYETGMAAWFDYIHGSMTRVERRLGAERLKDLLHLLTSAYNAQLEGASDQVHAEWIHRFLVEYYDPMYSYQMANSTRPILFEGRPDQVLEFLKSLN